MYDRGPTGIRIEYQCTSVGRLIKQVKNNGNVKFDSSFRDARCRSSKRPQALLNQYLVSTPWNRMLATDTRHRYHRANKVTKTSARWSLLIYRFNAGQQESKADRHSVRKLSDYCKSRSIETRVVLDRRWITRDSVNTRGRLINVRHSVRLIFN